jgi:hypothetical protein
MLMAQLCELLCVFKTDGGGLIQDDDDRIRRHRQALAWIMKQGAGHRSLSFDDVCGLAGGGLDPEKGRAFARQVAEVWIPRQKADLAALDLVRYRRRGGDAVPMMVDEMQSEQQAYLADMLGPELAHSLSAGRWGWAPAGRGESKV